MWILGIWNPTNAFGDALLHHQIILWFDILGGVQITHMTRSVKDLMMQFAQHSRLDQH